MHATLRNAFEDCLLELEVIDIPTAQLHPEGQPHLPSIQQRVESNVAMLRQHIELLEKRLVKGRVPRDNRCTRLEWGLQWMILGLGYIPQGSPMIDEKLLTPVVFDSLSGRELAKRISAELADLDNLLDTCKKKYGSERVEIHPLLGPLRVDQWRRCHALQLR